MTGCCLLLPWFHLKAQSPSTFKNRHRRAPSRRPLRVLVQRRTRRALGLKPAAKPALAHCDRGSRAPGARNSTARVSASFGAASHECESLRKTAPGRTTLHLHLHIIQEWVCTLYRVRPAHRVHNARWKGTSPEPVPRHPMPLSILSCGCRSPRSVPCATYIDHVFGAPPSAS